jgi:hypothetical protein
LYVKPLKVIDCVAVVGVVGGMQGTTPKQALLKPTKFVSTAPAAAEHKAMVAPAASVSAPGSENPPSVMPPGHSDEQNTANAISLNVYSASGTLLEQHVANAGLTLNQVAAGLDGSGIVFALTAAEQTQLNNTMAANAGAEVFTVGATFANAQGGPETISAIRLAAVAAVPEPAAYALMLAGLGVLGFIARRRSKRT